MKLCFLKIKQLSEPGLIGALWVRSRLEIHLIGKPLGPGLIGELWVGSRLEIYLIRKRLRLGLIS